MTPSLLGIPYSIWGAICLGLAVIWVLVWPKDRAEAGTPRYLILRWFHALTWLLLSLGAFFTASGMVGGATIGRPTAMAALPVYLVFMAAFATSRG